MTGASVAIDGSKFKAVNTRHKNFTREKVERRRAQLEKRVAPYLMQLDTADLQEPSEEVGLLETRAIQPPIAKRISFDEVAEAHRRLEAGGLAGKLVLSPDLPPSRNRVPPRRETIAVWSFSQTT